MRCSNTLRPRSSSCAGRSLSSRLDWSTAQARAPHLAGRMPRSRHASQHPLADWFAMEREQGTATPSTPSTTCSPTTSAVQSSRRPDAADADPLRDLVFILRTGALFPIYRTFSLLEQLTGPLAVPTSCSIRRPRLSGRAQFMGVLEAEHNYRPKIFLMRPLMTTAPTIRTLFDSKIDRRIEEVIKSIRQRGSDQDEIGRVRRHRRDSPITTRHSRAVPRPPNKPHEGIGSGVSGFFGSGNRASPRCWAWRSPTAHRRRAGHPALSAARVDDVKLQTLSGWSASRSRPTPSSSTSRPTAASAAATNR